MEGLKVEYGLDASGGLVSASNASKGQTYFCPSCNSKLVLRIGGIRVKHFAHPASSSCNQESILHLTAKKLIEAVIHENSSSRAEINLRSKCYQCGVKFNKTLPYRTFTSAKQEVAVSDYICDVVGYRDNEIALGIEILNTHQVDSNKAKGLPIHWIELNAESVLGNPTQWSPIQSRLKNTYCKRCTDNIKKVISIADRWGISRNLYSPIKKPGSSAYVADAQTCFKCKKEIPVFWWRGVPFCKTEPPEPMPKTIEYRYSKERGYKYWINTCANCHVIQGDNYLYYAEKAPFKNMPKVGESNLQQGGITRVVTGKSAVSEFWKTISPRR